MPLAPRGQDSMPAPYYLIGPGDTLDIFVWRNDDLHKTLRVRPDGRISVPLIDDVDAAGKTPTRLARDIEARLSGFVVDPIVTVMVVDFSGTFDQQIRVIGEAQKPQAIPYRDKMTVLDVMIAVGGLTEFASGNQAVISRMSDGKQKQYRVRLDDLIRDGDIGANVAMNPGDILIIPQRYI
ncbi:MAG: polysaccharide biosynthesis/export family protein [Rhodospirillales bacterium]|nr:polysaccharide biosynthesis/export family protein [Rhodospirillales bacterium]